MKCGIGAVNNIFSFLCLELYLRCILLLVITFGKKIKFRKVVSKIQVVENRKVRTGEN